MTSPIQQQIIDGLFYWDTFGNERYRLLERATQDVVGHYRREDGWQTTRWVAVCHARDYHATAKRTQRTFATAKEAKRWIEQNANRGEWT
jgi:hypothetical protein